MKHTKVEKQEYAAYLLEALREQSANWTKRVTFVATVAKVSRSGMNRRIKLAFIFQSHLYHMSYTTSVLLDWSINVRNELRVDGCGMDMIFHTLHSLFRKLAAYVPAEEQAAYRAWMVNQSNWSYTML